MAKILAFFIANIAAAAAVVHAAPANVTIVTVFAPGESGIAAYRIPGVLSIPGTTILLAFAEGRKYGCGDFGGEHLVMAKRSTNGGASWEGNAMVVADPASAHYYPALCTAAAGHPPSDTKNACQFWDPTPVWERATKSVLLFFTLSHTESGRMGGDMTAWMVRSRDYGVSWGPPANLTAQLWDPVWKMATPGNGHAVQLGPRSAAPGRVLVPVYARNDRNTSLRGQQYSGAWRSDDGGTTWAFDASVAGGGLVVDGTSEGEIVPLQLDPKRLLFFLRRDGRAPCGPPGSAAPRYCRWKAFSDDGGNTWAPPAGEPMPQLPDPGCKGGIAAWPERKALVEVNAATTHGRVNVTLRVSRDDGATWPYARMVSAPGVTAGYSDVAMVSKRNGTAAAAAAAAATAAAGAGAGATSSSSVMAAVLFEHQPAGKCSIRVGLVDPGDVVGE